MVLDTQDSDKIDFEKYIVRNIDRAVNEGWIQAYYQPVIRTLTGELCGMEALARWVDPIYGLLPPIKFIAPLEKSNQIHKLDCYILELVCRNIQRIVQQGGSPVPVSFNLSRLDFMLCDMATIVEHMVNRYGLSRDMLHIEITESMIGHDPEFMHLQVETFHKLGYQVWMDDFGSEYSSLNILKDFNFDELKIDMKFMSDFSMRSRKIVSAVVDMAKEINMQTLAEGVETREHFEFLRSIGCVKAQGYYFGRPMPYDESIKAIQERGIGIEDYTLQAYYDAIGKVNLMDGTLFSSRKVMGGDGYLMRQIPLSIIEYKGGKLHYLLYNKAYENEFYSFGAKSRADIESDLSEESMPVAIQMREAIERALESGEVETIDIMRNGYYCSMKIKAITTKGSRYTVMCTLSNLSMNANLLHRERLDEAMQMLCHVYDSVVLFHVDRDYVEDIYSNNKSIIINNENSTFSSNMEFFCNNFVYKADRERYREFLDCSTIEERAENNDKGFVSGRFRVKTIEGDYRWTVIILLPYREDGERLILNFVRITNIAGDEPDMNIPSAPSAEESEVSSEPISDSVLWHNIFTNADFGIFWKDRNRRFLGANKKFLEYFNINSISDLIGRTDEDMGWHVDPEPYRSDELRIIERGERTSSVPGHCIAKGCVRNILASKMPLYSNGKIEGLIGYFTDVTNQNIYSAISMNGGSDSLTGLYSLSGLKEESLRYTEAYFAGRLDYALIYMDIINFNFLNDSHGRAWADRLLTTVAECIKHVIGVTGVASRTGSCQFAILRQFKQEEEIEDICSTIVSALSSIQDIDGIPCSLELYISHALYTESNSFDQMYALAKAKVAALKRDNSI